MPHSSLHLPARSHTQRPAASFFSQPARRRNATRSLRGAVVALVEQLEKRAMMATYYVDATLGNDTFTGLSTVVATANAGPFRTISRAASAANPGDIVYIRTGIYRETITPPRSGTAAAPIVFQNFPGESPVISGADPLSNWTVTATGSSIYSASMPWTQGGIANADDQLFINNTGSPYLSAQQLIYARFPNTSLDLLRPTFDYAEAGTNGVLTTTTFNGRDTTTLTGTLVDPSLTQPDGYWNGAILHISSGPNWLFEAPVVTNYTRGTVTFTSSFTSATYLPVPGNPYWLSGKFQSLDAPGEYFVDTTAQRAYVWTPNSDNPNNYTIEAKRRNWAFELSGRSYITIRGLGIFGAGINSSSTSSNLVIDSINAKYVSYFNGYQGNWDTNQLNSGIVLAGTNNTLSNSEINFSVANGVSIAGNTNTITGNFIHNVNYAGRDGAAITAHQSFLSSGNYIANNTLSDSPRGLLLFRGMTNSRILYNRAFNAMLWTTDGAAFYDWNRSTAGIEIAYNIISDAFIAVNGNPAAGIFLDGSAPGAVVHHNVVYNANNGIKNNASAGPIYYYNNTLAFNPQGGLQVYGTDLPSGSVINNLSTTANLLPNSTNYSVGTNISGLAAPGFANTNTFNFQLTAAATTAVDRGTAIPGYTDGSINAPDIGAYELGSNVWTAGASASLTSSIPAAPTTLTATANSITQVNLSWLNNATNATRFVISRSNDNRIFRDIAIVNTVSPGINTYADTTVGLDGYYYRVRADNGYTTSPYSLTSFVRTGRDPYVTNAATSADAASTGVDISTTRVGSFNNGSWVRYDGFEFGSGTAAGAFDIRLASPGTAGRTVTLRLDSLTGTAVGSFTPINTGGYGTYAYQGVTLTTPATGRRDLYLVGAGGSGIANLSEFSFVRLPSLTSAVVNDGTPQRSMVRSLTLNFSTPVSLPASAITLARTAGGLSAAVNVSPASGTSNSFTLTFSGTSILGRSLPDGQYTLTLNAPQVTDAANAPLYGFTGLNFFRLFGDTTGDGRVDSADIAQFTPSYAAVSPATNYLSDFDYDDNGTINNIDLLQLRKRNGTSVF